MERERRVRKDVKGLAEVLNEWTSQDLEDSRNENEAHEL